MYIRMYVHKHVRTYVHTCIKETWNNTRHSHPSWQDLILTTCRLYISVSSSLYPTQNTSCTNVRTVNIMYVCTYIHTTYVHMYLYARMCAHIQVSRKYVHTVLFTKNWTTNGGQSVYVRWPSGHWPLYVRRTYGCCLYLRSFFLSSWRFHNWLVAFVFPS